MSFGQLASELVEAVGLENFGLHAGCPLLRIGLSPAKLNLTSNQKFTCGGRFHKLFCTPLPTFEKLFRGIVHDLCHAPNFYGVEGIGSETSLYIDRVQYFSYSTKNTFTLNTAIMAFNFNILLSLQAYNNTNN